MMMLNNYSLISRARS